MSATDYINKLNEEQKAAALATEGPVLVLAGAGSGTSAAAEPHSGTPDGAQRRGL